MKGHLSNEELASQLLGEFDGAREQHLESCSECRAEIERLGKSLRVFKTWVHEQAALREPTVNVFEVTQFDMKSKRNGDAPLSRWMRVAALAALIIFALLLMRPTQVQPVQNAEIVPQPDADDALLIEVQNDLEREVPHALAPAVMLTAERNRMIEQTQVQNQ